MCYREAVEELFRRRTKGVKLGLDRVYSALEKLGNPQSSFQAIHIAGTNGKGSVSKIVYQLLRTHNLSVGLFTSPHLVRFTERIVVDDREIEEEEVLRLIKEIEPYGEELTFFEYVTVMAFLYFKERGVDFAVVETGLGGRLDATNVLMPKVSVITKIGFDHMEFLGSSLSDIAMEKAGIIKRGVPVVTASEETEAETVIYKRASEMSSEIAVYGRDFFGQLREMSLSGVIFDFESSLGVKFERLFLPVCGEYQVENASVSIEAFLRVIRQWSEEKIREALGSVRIPGRLEIVSLEPLIVLDIAHNPQAASYLVSSLRKLTERKPVLVFGVMRDKDVEGIVRAFEGYAETVVVTEPSYERSLSASQVVERIRGFRFNSLVIKNPKQAFAWAKEYCKGNPECFVLVTGSAYLVGEIKEALGEQALLRGLGEIL